MLLAQPPTAARPTILPLPLLLLPLLFGAVAAAMVVAAAPAAGHERASDAPAAAIEVPTVDDRRLVVELFAAEPDIVTPIGIAPHPQGGVLVVESHTHSPPRDYPGPDYDRILWLRDTTGDGRADQRRVFAEGFDDAMNLVTTPDGLVLVIQRAGVVRLEDHTGDGLADVQQTIVRLETRESYDHNTLLSLAYTPDGRLLVGRGNTAGRPYRLVGTDGSQVAGYGDGGNVVVTNRRGENLRVFATGFWNPFGLYWDRRGWLLCADNDPDAVGPNRLVHLVDGGDYGYRAAYGPSGRWPLQAWNGELPGTLPLLAATGEAPGTLARADDAAMPPDYHGQLLVAVWGTHRVDRYAIRPTSQGLRSEPMPWLEGGVDFRPVAVTAADGALYVTDWVLKDYPNHGLGRIWRVRWRDDGPASDEAAAGAAVASPPPDEPDPYATRLERIAAAGPEQLERLAAAAADPDPFVRSAAVTALARMSTATLTDWSRADDPPLRLASLLAMRRGQHAPTSSRWHRWLDDADVDVRIAALSWIADDVLDELRPSLDRALAQQPVPARLVEVYLAADQALSDESLEARADERPLMNVRRRFLTATIDRLLAERPSDEVLLSVLSVAGDARRSAVFDAARQALDAEHPGLRREAIDALGNQHAADADRLLIKLATDADRPVDERADATAALGRRGDVHRALLLELAADSPGPVALEALRALAPHAADPQLRARVAELAAAEPLGWPDPDRARAWREQLERWRDAPASPTRPAEFDQWLAAVGQGGDPAAGRRLFFQPRNQCTQCHQWHGRGGGVGPDLSGVGASQDRRGILRSLLYPSENIAPQYVSHTLVTADGQVVTGIQFHYRQGGRAVSILTMEGDELTFPLSDVDHYAANRHSMMPDELVEQLTIDELRDLLAFLAQRPGERGASAP